MEFLAAEGYLTSVAVSAVQTRGIDFDPRGIAKRKRAEEPQTYQRG